METQLINISILFAIGALFAAFEIIVDKYEDTIFPQGVDATLFFNPIYSWKNKYDKSMSLAPTKGLYGFYHKHFNLKYREKFLLSGTTLVFLTDFRHLLKLLLVISIIGLAIFYEPFMGIWIDWLIGAFIILATFELFYSQILIRKR